MLFCLSFVVCYRFCCGGRGRDECWRWRLQERPADRISSADGAAAQVIPAAVTGRSPAGDGPLLSNAQIYLILFMLCIQFSEMSVDEKKSVESLPNNAQEHVLSWRTAAFSLIWTPCQWSLPTVVVLSIFFLNGFICYSLIAGVLSLVHVWQSPLHLFSLLLKII